MYLTDMVKLYEYTVYSIPGSINFLADLLSRAFTQSRFFNKDKYNLSKETAEQLPALGPMFSIDPSTLIKYFQSEMLPVKGDKGSRQNSLPRHLEPVLTLYMNCTPEERYIDTILLFKQISKKISSSELNSTIEVEGTNGLRLSEDEIKHFINHDISKGSESKKATYIKPILERIIEDHFGADLDPKYKIRIRDTLLNNFLKMRRIESSSSYLLNIYNKLSTKLVEEINNDIHSSCEYLNSHSIKQNNSAYNQTVIEDDGTVLKILPEFPDNILLEKTLYNNIDIEDNKMSNIGYSINLQLLHSNVEKLDLIEKLSKDKMRVYQKGKKLDTNFSCTGKFPPKTATYNFNCGIDLYIQAEVVLEPNIMTKINTQTKILINTTTCGIIYPKSRTMGKILIFRGVIDSNYTGDIIIGVTNITKEPITLSEGSSNTLGAVVVQDF